MIDTDPINTTSFRFPAASLMQAGSAEEMISTLIEEHLRELDKDVRGAYRAGYSYLYVAHKKMGLGYTPDLLWPTGELFDYYSYPSNSEIKPKNLMPNADEYKWTVYELDEIDSDEYRKTVKERVYGV